MNRMTRSVNIAILALFVVATASGGLAFTVGTEPVAGVVVAVHGASGLGLLILVPAKAGIARRGLRRPGRSRKVISSTLAVLAALTLVGGLLHAIGGFRPVLGLLPMQIHVGAALAALGLGAAHVVAHRRRMRRIRPPRVAGSRHASRRDAAPGGPTARVDRRRLLAGAGLVGGSAALWWVAPGRERRFTGSHEVGSGDPAAMPVTQWLLDPVPRIAPAGWRLRVDGVAAFDLAALAALPNRTQRAVLDCTGGWWAEQEWTGVALSALGLRAGAAVDVVSVTGYRRRLPARDLDALLLATHVGGRPLSAGHGGPARLVAPGRRGYWWVKWVVAVEAVDEPWWWQAPLPLQ